MLFVGLLLIALGFAAAAFPLAAGISAELFYGVTFIFVALAHFTGVARSHRDFFYNHGALALIFLITGFLLIGFPKVGLFSIALVIGVGFFFQGVLQIAFAVSNSALKGRAALGLSGAVGVIAGGAILYGWPFDSAWVFGVLVGLNLVFLGLAVLSLWSTMRNARKFA